MAPTPGRSPTRALDIVHPDDQSLVIESWVRVRAGASTPRLRQRMRRRDGTWVWFEVVNHDRLDDPAYRCVLGEMVDISEEMAANEALREREQLLIRLAETVPVGLAEIDADGAVRYANERLHEILGAGESPMLEKALQTLIPEDRERVQEGIGRLLAAGSAADFEVALQLSSDDEARFATINLRALTRDDGSVNGGIVCVVDCTETVRMRDALRVRATFDDLTGCHNRGSIMQALQAHITTQQRRSDRAVLFVDLDGFKAVNDRLGHAAGDELVGGRRLGRWRVRRCRRPRDVRIQERAAGDRPSRSAAARRRGLTAWRPGGLRTPRWRCRGRSRDPRSASAPPGPGPCARRRRPAE